MCRSIIIFSSWFFTLSSLEWPQTFGHFHPSLVGNFYPFWHLKAALAVFPAPTNLKISEAEQFGLAVANSWRRYTVPRCQHAASSAGMPTKRLISTGLLSLNCWVYSRISTEMWTLVNFKCIFCADVMFYLFASVRGAERKIHFFCLSMQEFLWVKKQLWDSYLQR